jgi:hypothetical protein
MERDPGPPGMGQQESVCSRNSSYNCDRYHDLELENFNLICKNPDLREFHYGLLSELFTVIGVGAAL